MALHITHIAPTSYFSDYGCHVRIYEETRALASLGYQSTIYTYGGGTSPGPAQIIRIPKFADDGAVKVGSQLKKAWLDPILLATASIRGVGKPVDLVHAHLHEGALIGKFVAMSRRVPMVFDFQGSLLAEMLDHGFIGRQSKLTPLISLVERSINRLPNKIVTSSTNARNLLIDSFGIAPDRVAAISDCVDTSAFMPRPTHPENNRSMILSRYRIPNNRLIIGYLGLLADYQGIPHLIEAAAKVIQSFPGVHFLLMGYPGVETYKRMVSQKGIEDHVTFTGRISYFEAPQHLAATDIAVSPKLSETEGNGKLLNYMATGLPTVAFDGEVAREYLGENGRFAVPRDSDSLADNMLELLHNATARTTEGKSLRRRAEANFSWDRGRSQLHNIYQELLQC